MVSAGPTVVFDRPSRMKTFDFSFLIFSAADGLENSIARAASRHNTPHNVFLFTVLVSLFTLTVGEILSYNWIKIFVGGQTHINDLVFWDLFSIGN